MTDFSKNKFLLATLVFSLFMSFVILSHSYTATAQELSDDFDLPQVESQSEPTAPEEELDLSGTKKEDFDINSATQEEKEVLAKDYYDKAVDLHLAGYLYQAIANYRNAVFLDPEMAAYHADLGEAYRVIGRPREAINELETAIEISPTMVNAYTTLGVIYENENLPQKAIEYHRKAIKIKPDHFVSYNNLGHSYELLGLKKAAVENYKRAIEINEKFSPAYDNLGTMMMQLGKVDDGITMIQKAIVYAEDGHPQLGLFYNDLGAAYVMKKMYNEAYDAFVRANELMPGNNDISLNLKYIEEYMNGKGN